MSENAIILCIVLAAVAVIAAVFIRRAKRHREIVKASPPEEISMEIHPKDQSAEDIYLARFVWFRQERTGSRKTIRVRPEYYDRIRAITRTIGHDRVSLIAYLDNVLKAHFDDNRDVINTLYRKDDNELFKTDE